MIKRDLIFNDIVYSYQGADSPALDNLSLRFSLDERVALVGHNGSGKSTLMLIANGIYKPKSGGVFLDEQPVIYDRAGLLALRQKVGVVFQNPDDQLFSASVMQDISAGPLNLGLSNEETFERVSEVAEICGLKNLLDRPTFALSGGEKTRVALAGILAMRPVYLFADEIANSLDPWMRSQVFAILNAWVEQGNTVVLSTHDWHFASQWAQRVVWLEHGAVYQQGNPEEVLCGCDIDFEGRMA